MSPINSSHTRPPCGTSAGFNSQVVLSHMDIPQQRWSHESPFRSKLDLHQALYEGRANHQSKDETPTAHKPNKTRPSSQSPRLDQKASGAAPIPSRSLPSIQPDNPSAARQGVPQQAPSAHNVIIRPTPLSSSTPPKQRLSRPNGVEYLLNPTARDTTSAGSRQHGGDGTDSPWTAPIAATSRPVIPPPTSMKKRPSGDITLPSITPALMNLYPHPLSPSTTPRLPTRHEPYLTTSGPPIATINAQQPPAMFPRDQASVLTGSDPLLPSEIMTAPSMLRAAHPPPVPPARPSSRVQTQVGRTGNPASRNSSPPSALFQLTSTSKPQSHLPTPFTSTGPTSTMPLLAFNKEAFDAPTSEISGQSQYPIMILETEQGPIQVPLNVQAASKVADEKRKRNATASHCFRQRRKEKEQENSNNLSILEAQVREMTEEKVYYQQERDFLQDVVLRNHIPIPPRPLSPRRRRHALLGGPQTPDTDTSAQNGGRITRRRTGAYEPQGLPPHTGAAHVPF